MSPQLEFEGKNLDVAIEKAGKKLNIPKEALQYDVLSYGSSGIFGLVRTKKAKIRVKLTGEPKTSQVKAKAPSKRKPSSKKKEAAKETVQKDVEIEKVEEKDTPPLDLEVLAKNGEQSLERIVGSISDEAKISVEIAEEKISFKIAGGNASILIGRRGQTLEAIQYLVEKIVNREAESRVRIQVDVEGYIEKRISYLEELAGRLAQKVKKTGRAQTIGQMNAHDRRIVHLALKDDEKVKTQSVGGGFYRKLMIFPKKKEKKKAPPK